MTLDSVRFLCMKPSPCKYASPSHIPRAIFLQKARAFSWLLDETNKSFSNKHIIHDDQCAHTYRVYHIKYFWICHLSVLQLIKLLVYILYFNTSSFVALSFALDTTTLNKSYNDPTGRHCTYCTQADNTKASRHIIILQTADRSLNATL